MAVKQGKHHLAPCRLLLQCGLWPFKQLMQLEQPAKQLAVVQQCVIEGRQVAGGQFQFFQQLLDLRIVRVKSPVTPTRIMAFVTIVHFVRVDQHQGAGGRQMLGAAIAITLGAFDNHADHKTIMHMGHEAVFDIARRQQLHTRQGRRLPEADRLTLFCVHYADSSRSAASHCGILRSR